MFLWYIWKASGHFLFAVDHSVVIVLGTLRFMALILYSYEISHCRDSSSAL